MYQVIARKYRPQNFSELIGQEHVQRTLTNAIQSSRLAHGYIFSGQRGTGKTTVARILARCLNCVQGPTSMPCGVCSSCVEIAAGNSVDVIEIDAASNRGINEMREVRENVRYRPARDLYKIFIIDEAHQITKEAFNALLKTLEEPPEWVVFILCTTEAYEIPNTIASRCQQFTFRSVDFAELVTRMRHIVQLENIEADDDVLSVLAQAGEGSVRDSLSALDQAIACCGQTLTVNEIRNLLGMFGVDSLSAVAQAILNQDSGAMLDLVEELERTGQSLQHFCRELSRYWRNLLVAKISGTTSRLIAASDREQQVLLDTASSFAEEDLTRYLNLTLDLYKTMQYSLQPRLQLELGLVKLVQASRIRSVEDALASLNGGGAPATPPKSSTSRKPELGTTAPARSEHAQTIVKPETPPKAVTSSMTATAPKIESSKAATITGDLKNDLHSALIAAGANFTADALGSALVSLEGNDLVLRAPKTMVLSLRDASMKQAAKDVLGRPVQVRIEVGQEMSVAAPRADIVTPDEGEVRERALSHPGVKRFQELFPGAQVRTVRNLSE